MRDLKSRGASRSTGMSESNWEAMVIPTAHSVCDWAALGISRAGIVAHEKARWPDNNGTVQALVDAAVATYCPEYWGSP